MFVDLRDKHEKLMWVLDSLQDKHKESPVILEFFGKNNLPIV